MTNVKKLKKPIDQDVVSILKQALASAEMGQTIGVILLLNLEGNNFTHAAAGDMKLSDAMLTFRSWEFEQLLLANRDK